jgi:TrmH family RNA methyltransferase
MHPIVTSPQNPKIKNVVALEKARTRKLQQEFAIEGRQEISMALLAGYQLTSAFFCPEIISVDDVTALITNESLLIPVQHNVFEKMAYRDGTGGIIAVAKQKKHQLEDLKLRENPLLLILESVEKPGNLGAILRTADAANLDGVIICDPQTDFYNPNVIRSSVGSVFTTPLAVASSEATREWLAKNSIRCLATHLEAARPYYAEDLRGPTAIVMGTESTGLSAAWVNHATATIIIPMHGKVDSLNVSNASAIIVFEANRQRSLT